MSNEITTNRKRCKWCHWSSHNPHARNSGKKHLCGHVKNHQSRSMYWPKTGCPGFIREPGSDDDYYINDKKGMFA